MKLRLSHCALVSGCVCATALAVTLIFDRAATPVLEFLLSPWFAICEALTPAPWLLGGNLLPGIIWLLSGVAVYSIFLGTIFVLIRTSIKRRARAIR